jgi:proline iminopeptidase
VKINPVSKRLIRFVSQMHVCFYRLWGGMTPLNRNTLILTTRGRKTGREISKPLLYVEDGGRLYLVASYGGSDSAPAWYLNLAANPEVKVRIGRSEKTCRARILTSDEAKPLWPKLLAIYPAYADYQKKTLRLIPIVELTPH